MSYAGGSPLPEDGCRLSTLQALTSLRRMYRGHEERVTCIKEGLAALLPFGLVKPQAEKFQSSGKLSSNQQT